MCVPLWTFVPRVLLDTGSYFVIFTKQNAKVQNLKYDIVPFMAMLSKLEIMVYITMTKAYRYISY